MVGDGDGDGDVDAILSGMGQLIQFGIGGRRINPTDSNVHKI